MTESDIAHAKARAEKACPKCGDTKPLTEFCKNPRRRDGLRCYCRSCDAARIAKWRANNPESAAERVAKWNAANPNYYAARYAANREEIRARAAARYAANTDKVKSAAAEWRAANPEARRVIEQNRRARKRKAGGKLSAGLADRLYKLQRGKCACGCRQPLGSDYHLDHVMPLALGGANEDWNIQLLRQQCNNQKHAKHPIEFMQQRGFLL